MGANDILQANLIRLRRKAGLTQMALAETLGFTRSTVSAYESGLAKPPLDALLRFAKFYGHSLDDMVAEAAGEIKREGKFKATGIAADETPRVVLMTVGEDERENIELVDSRAAAGYAAGYADPEFVKQLPRFRLPMLPTGTYRAFEIAGDSMLPIPSGTVVVGQYVESLDEVKPKNAYVVVTRNNGLLFKRVAAVDKSSVVLQSDNANYSSYAMPLEEVQEVWQAKIYIGKA